jgi:hypothetical protein
VIHIFVNFEDSEKDVIQLVIDENNDLTFKVAVQGTNQNPTMSRLLLKLSEDKSIAFSGRVSGQDSLSFVVPSLVESVKPETTYECSVEMVVVGSNSGKTAATFAANASGVNYLAHGGTATTIAPTITATGTDTNISINLVPKGTGRVQSGGVTVPTISSTDTLTNKSMSGGSNTFTNIPNSALTNSSTTVNGQTCTLGSSCTVTAAATTVTVGTTTVASGTSNGLLYNNAGTLGNTAAGTAGQLLIGQAGAPTWNSVSGNVTISSSGVTTIGANQVSLSMLATQAANTVVANVSGSTAAPTAASLPSCSTSASALIYTSGTGFSCNTTIAASVANPTASIGLTAVNGSATTAMRSDGAPALSQAIAPTWTGQHTFSTAGFPTIWNGNGSGSNIKIGTASGVTATATPDSIDLGSSYSSTAGANPKLILWSNGGTKLGFGFSLGQFDYIVSTGTGHAFFNNGTSTPTMKINGSYHLEWSGTAPALTSCGTSPAISGNDVAGEVTMGTGSPAACTITFATAYNAAPYCVVTWQGNPLAAQNYSVSASAITIGQTATSSNKLNYHCIARSGG